MIRDPGSINTRSTGAGSALTSLTVEKSPCRNSSFADCDISPDGYWMLGPSPNLPFCEQATGTVAMANQPMQRRSMDLQGIITSKSYAGFQGLATGGDLLGEIRSQCAVKGTEA